MTPPPPPPRIARLPRDKHDRPVPWFVAWIDGAPDFRIVARGKVEEALRFEKCFVCGDRLGRRVTFPVGPMCTINRTAPEPPCHKECAIYAAESCPFLTRPNMRRREAGLPAGHRLDTHAPGLAAGHNPGVTAIWTTRQIQPVVDDNGGILVRMGDPDEVLWFAEGRAATRAEAEESLAAEADVLRGLTRQAERDARLDAELAAIDAAYQAALRYLPA